MCSTRKLTFRAKQGQRALRRATPHVLQPRPGGPGRERGGRAEGAAPGPDPTGRERSGAEPARARARAGAPPPLPPALRDPRGPVSNAPRRRARCWRDGTLPCPAPSRPGRDCGETHLLRRCPAWGLASGAAGRLDPAAASAAAASHGGAALIAGTSRRSQAGWVWKRVTTCQDGVAPNPPPWERGEDLSELGKPGPLPRSEGQRLPRAPRPGPARPGRQPREPAGQGRPEPRHRQPRGGPGSGVCVGD